MMWFSRKQRNRRLGRDHVLEVKLRSSKVRSARARMAALALGILFGTVLGIYALWRTGEWAMDRLVYDNPSFAIKTIDIQTDGVLSPEQLRRWSGVRPGQNLLALDLSRVKRDLELIAIVRSASVERIMPHTVLIRVNEREPVARIQVPSMRPDGNVAFTEFQLDTEGFVMLPIQEKPAPVALATNENPLPLISGLSGQQIQTGRQIDHPQSLAAVRLILALEDSPMAGLVDFKEIRVESPEVLIVLTSQGSEVTFGLAGLDRQLRRWRAIHDQSLRANQAILAVDLAVSNSVPVRLVELAARSSQRDDPTGERSRGTLDPTWGQSRGTLDPTSPKPAKPSRTRKKNV